MTIDLTSNLTSSKDINFFAKWLELAELFDLTFHLCKERFQTMLDVPEMKLETVHNLIIDLSRAGFLKDAEELEKAFLEYQVNIKRIEGELDE